MRRFLTLMLGMLLLSSQLLAQTRTVTGKVTDASGAPIAGASVQVKGTSTGTVTKEDGTFTIAVPNNSRTLTVSAVGQSAQDIAIGNQNTINVLLQAGSQQNLQEVVVVGYTSTTKEAFTGSAKAVSGEQLNNKAVSNPTQALAGEVSGVRVINTSGQPGTTATVRIRGIGSVNGNRDPLYVVDGVPFSGAINAINPADIASMTVLKDAAATAIYGSRGANGVVVITTRNGRGRKSFIEADARFGTNRSILPRYDVITSPEEYIGLSWEAVYNRGVALGNADPVAYANGRLFSANGIAPAYNIWNATAAQLIDPATKSVKPGVTRRFDPERWEDYAFQPSNRSDVTVRFGGGDAKTNYYTSFGYLDDKGYSIKSDFRRLNARLNLNQEVKSWLTTGMNINFANTSTNNNGQASNSNSVFWFVDNIPTIYPLFLRDAQGQKVPDPIFGGFQYDYGGGAQSRGFGGLTNAIADATYNTIRSKRNDVSGNASATIKFTKDLSLENRFGMQYYNNTAVSLTNKFYGSAATQNGSIGHTRTELLNTNFLNMLRYAKRFDVHNVEVLAAHEASNNRTSIASASGYNLITSTSLELNNAVVSNPVSSYSNTNKLESYFGQVNYDYASKYYLSATIRRDGSSRFVKDKWGTFGSVGAGVVLSKMEFMRRQNILSYLKLKASYGILGDQAGVGLYPGYDRFDLANLNNNAAITFTSRGNPDLTWETSKMFQTGVDFRLGTFLDGSIDYYVKNTDNLIFERRVGPSQGYAIITVNDGQLRNQGLEFDLTGHILKTNNYFLDLGVNGEHFTNKITAMPIDPATAKQKPIDVQAPYGWSVGHSIYDFYIRNFAGVDPKDGISMWTVYYTDTDNDGKFTSGEQVASLDNWNYDNPGKTGTLKTGTTKVYSEATQYYVGKSALPKVRGAFNLSGGFKGLELDVQLLYSFGGYAYDYAYAGLMGNGVIGNNNWSVDIRNRWQKVGDVTAVPRLSSNYDLNVNSTSTRFLTKADYLSLNNVRLGYTLPSNLVQKTNIIEQATFFVSADNLWLHTKRNGFNPSTAESGASDTYRYSPLSTITAGVKVKF